MNIEPLLNRARLKVSANTPSYVDMQKVVAASRQEVADMAVERMQTAMEQAILGAQSILRTTSQEYIEALYITDDLTIAIREDKMYLEEGYDRREMLESMLSSPKAKTSAGGDRYVVVPIGKTPAVNISSAIGKKTSELFTKGRKAGSSVGTLGGMISDMQDVLKGSGNAPYAPRNSQKKEFRTAIDSQNSDTQWTHPGFQGVNQLEFINQQLRSELESGAQRVLEDNVNRMRR